MAYSVRLARKGLPAAAERFTEAEWEALRGSQGFPGCALYVAGSIEAKSPTQVEIAEYWKSWHQK